MTWQEERKAHEERLLAELATEGGAPNLDAMTYEDLEAFSSIAVRRIITAIWRTREYSPELLVAAAGLRSYARARSLATQARVKGHSDLALRIESQCDAQYLRLPTIARW